MAVLVVLLALTASCAKRLEPSAADEPREPSFGEQAAAALVGNSNTIRLDHTLVRDDDLAALESLADKPLRINLSHTEITDEGMARIGRLRRLEQLRLSSPRVDDEGLAAIAGLKELRFLHLLDMPITDAGLDRLHGLTSLESLYLDRTKVSDEGLARLIKALPGVHLHIDEHHHPLDPHAAEHSHASDGGRSR